MQHVCWCSAHSFVRELGVPGCCAVTLTGHFGFLHTRRGLASMDAYWSILVACVVLECEEPQSRTSPWRLAVTGFAGYFCECCFEYVKLSTGIKLPTRLSFWRMHSCPFWLIAIIVLRLVQLRSHSSCPRVAPFSFLSRHADRLGCSD